MPIVVMGGNVGNRLKKKKNEAKKGLGKNNSGKMSQSTNSENRQSRASSLSFRKEKRHIVHTYTGKSWPLHSYIQLANYCGIITCHDIFNGFIITVICIAGVLVGMQTYPGFDTNPIVEAIDMCVLVVFVAEVLAKIIAEGFKPWKYFTGPEWKWNNFDFMVSILCMPVWGSTFGGSSVALLRLMRLLRVMKLIKKIPQLQMIVMGLIGGMKSIGYIMALLFLVFYLYGVLGVYTFRENDPFHYGNLFVALNTLFRLCTLENWTDVLHINYFGCNSDVYDSGVYTNNFNDSLPYGLLYCSDETSTSFGAVSIIYFVSYIIISALVMLSLFVGAVTMSMTESMEQMKLEKEEVKRQKKIQLALQRQKERKLHEEQDAKEEEEDKTHHTENSGDHEQNTTHILSEIEETNTYLPNGARRTSTQGRRKSSLTLKQEDQVVAKLQKDIRHRRGTLDRNADKIIHSFRKHDSLMKRQSHRSSRALKYQQHLSYSASSSSSNEDEDGAVEEEDNRRTSPHNHSKRITKVQPRMVHSKATDVAVDLTRRKCSSIQELELVDSNTKAVIRQNSNGSIAKAETLKDVNSFTVDILSLQRMEKECRSEQLHDENDALCSFKSTASWSMDIPQPSTNISTQQKPMLPLSSSMTNTTIVSPQQAWQQCLQKTSTSSLQVDSNIESHCIKVHDISSMNYDDRAKSAKEIKKKDDETNLKRSSTTASLTKSRKTKHSVSFQNISSYVRHTSFMKTLRRGTSRGRRPAINVKKFIAQTWHGVHLVDLIEDLEEKNRLAVENSGGPLKRKWRTFSKHCKKLVQNPTFVNFITFVIIVAGVQVGAQTFENNPPILDEVLVVVDAFILGIFFLEVLLKTIAQEFRPWLYFYDRKTGIERWNTFDYFVVFGSLVPGTGSMLILLRLLRLLRVLKLVRSLPELQIIVVALINGLSAISYIGVIMFMVFYVFAIGGMMLFQENDPWNFGTLHISLFTLFYCATLEGWTDVMYINMYGCNMFGYTDKEDLCVKPEPRFFVAALYFIVFTVTGALVLMTLFIGVVTTSMEAATSTQYERKDLQDRVKRIQKEEELDDKTILKYERIFKLLDLDGGGTIEQEELRLSLKDVGKVLPEDQLRVMLKAADSEESGELDFPQFVLFMCLMKNNGVKKQRRKKSSQENSSHSLNGVSTSKVRRLTQNFKSTMRKASFMPFFSKTDEMPSNDQLVIEPTNRTTKRRVSNQSKVTPMQAF